MDSEVRFTLESKDKSPPEYSNLSAAAPEATGWSYRGVRVTIRVSVSSGNWIRGGISGVFMSSGWGKLVPTL